MWIHYLILVSLFFVSSEGKGFLLVMLLANIFVQQFKLLTTLKDLVTLCTLYQKPVYFISISNLLVASLIMLSFSAVVPPFLIIGVLLPGFTFNILKTILNAN